MCACEWCTRKKELAHKLFWPEWCHTLTSTLTYAMQSITNSSTTTSARESSVRAYEHKTMTMGCHAEPFFLSCWLLININKTNQNTSDASKFVRIFIISYFFFRSLSPSVRACVCVGVKNLMRLEHCAINLIRLNFSGLARVCISVSVVVVIVDDGVVVPNLFYSISFFFCSDYF